LIKRWVLVVPLDVNMYTDRLIVDRECLVLCLLSFGYGFGCFRD